MIVYLFMRYFVLLLFFIYSCTPSGTVTFKGLKLIPTDQIADRVKAGTFNYTYATFVNANGEPITSEQKTQLNKGLLGKDYYEDKTGQIQKVFVRSITIEDKLAEIQRIRIANNPLSQFATVDIDCNDLDNLYADVQNKDQESRLNADDMQRVDIESQQKVISAINKCGITENHLSTIWLVLQHSNSDVMAYFYSDLKRLSQKGMIDKGSIAAMEDQLLMFHGYKQVYGTQINIEGLYNMEDPTNVNKRRTAVGLGPIEEYIAKWGMSFEEEMTKMGVK